MRVHLKKRGDGSWSQDVEFALIDVFGQQVPYEATLKIRTVLQVLLRDGIDVNSREASEKTGVSARYIRTIRQVWGEELRKLRNDAQYLGYDAEDLASYLEFGGGTVFVKKLRMLHEARGEQPAGLLPAQFRNAIGMLWAEYKETKAYQGYAADEWDISPPNWFIEDELGLTIGSDMMLIRSSSEFIC